MTGVYLFKLLLSLRSIIISDLQPSTAIVNQLPGHLVSTQIRTTVVRE